MWLRTAGWFHVFERCAAILFFFPPLLCALYKYRFLYKNRAIEAQGQCDRIAWSRVNLGLHTAFVEKMDHCIIEAFPKISHDDLSGRGGTKA